LIFQKSTSGGIGQNRKVEPLIVQPPIFLDKQTFFSLRFHQNAGTGFLTFITGQQQMALYHPVKHHFPQHQHNSMDKICFVKTNKKRHRRVADFF